VTYKTPTRRQGMAARLPPQLRRVPRWGWWAVMGASYLVCVLSFSVLTGVAAGRQQTQAGQSEAIARAVQEQFDLGVQDLLETRYELARQRFEYVLSIDPAYPGATELLDKALLGLNAPTTTPVPPTIAVTPTATLDLSSLGSLYQQAESAFAGEDWTTTIQALLTIRSRDPQYRRAEANQMMAAALRARGLEKIWAGQQEQGIYDLALAERFGPLDSQATSWRSSAAFYLFANSYFGVVWQEAARYFSQICAAGGWDSCYKYAVAAKEYGNELMKADDPCAAVDQFEASLDTRQDSAVEDLASDARDACLTATAEPPTPTITVTPTLGLPIETPTETPTLGPSPTSTPTTPPLPPTETPTPSETPTP
jgi:tetratricopeptide (TPR) repeat protein